MSTRILLAMQSYRSALSIKNLLDWEKFDCTLTIELSDVSGVHIINHLKPDILILHNCVGWLGPESYLDALKKYGLKPKIIFITDHLEMYHEWHALFNLDVQLLEAKTLSSKALKEALLQAKDALLLDRQSLRTNLPVIDKGIKALFSYAIKQNYHQCLLVYCQLEHAVVNPQARSLLKRKIQSILDESYGGSYAREDDQHYWILLNVYEGKSEPRQVRYAETLAHQLADCFEDVTGSRILALLSSPLPLALIQQEYARMASLQSIQYFCGDKRVLAIDSINTFLSPTNWERVDALESTLFLALLTGNSLKCQDMIHNIYMDEIKPAMSTTNLNQIRNHLFRFYRYMANSDDPELKFGDFWSIEQEASHVNKSFHAIIEKRKHEIGELHPIVLRTLSTLILDYDQPLSLQILAMHQNVSEAYLSKLFKKQLRMGIVECLQSIRIRAAKAYMNNGESSVTQTAHACGFNDPKYFSRVFKKIVGQSPSNYISSVKFNGKWSEYESS